MVDAIYKTADWNVVAAYCEHHRDGVLCQLGAHARRLVELVGFAAVLKLAAHPAHQLYIPQDTSKPSRLHDLVGDDAVEALADEYRAGHIETPQMSAIIRALQPTLAHDMRQAGRSVPEIARSLFMSVRNVRRILNGNHVQEDADG